MPSPFFTAAWRPLLLLSFLIYALLCQLLRFRRVNQKHAHYPYKTRCSFASMTAQHAYEIQQYIFVTEFPFTSEKALQFALFRTYGIPSISKLLVQTKQLSEKATASKRYADTEVLITEFVEHPPTSERANAAIARMNYIHSIYQKAGRISNDDMLYTLALFAVEPVRWIARYEWRSLTPMEICAIGTFWKSIGDAMGILYSPLVSSKEGWRDGLQWFEEIEAWSRAYEEEHMVPDLYNKKTADETTAMLLYDIPEILREPGKRTVSALMDDRLRNAMMYPKPPPSYVKAINTALTIRKFLLRYLALPRPVLLRRYAVSPEADKKTGRYHKLLYVSEPWYVKDSFMNRYGIFAWRKWFAGLPIPGEKFKPEGYLIHEVGPCNMEGKGREEFEGTKNKLMSQGRGGCPFAFS